MEFDFIDALLLLASPSESGGELKLLDQGVCTSYACVMHSDLFELRASTTVHEREGFQMNPTIFLGRDLCAILPSPYIVSGVPIFVS